MNLFLCIFYMLFLTVVVGADNQPPRGYLLINNYRYDLGSMIVENYGLFDADEDDVYNIDIVLAPPGATADDDEPEYYVYLEMFFPSDFIGPGTYTLNTDHSAFSISPNSMLAFENEYHPLSDGSVAISLFEEVYYTITGTINSMGQDIRLTYEGEITEYLASEDFYDDTAYSTIDGDGLYEGAGSVYIAGETIPLNWVHLNYYGQDDGVYNIDFSLRSDYYQGEIYLEMFFPANDIIPGTYTFSDDRPQQAFIFSDLSSVEFLDYHHMLLDGSLVIATDNGSYSITGDLQSDAEHITFSFAWSE